MKMEKKIRQSRILSAKDQLGKNIVESIKNKNIVFGDAITITSHKDDTNGKDGYKYKSEINEKDAYMTVEKVMIKGSIQARCYLTLFSNSNSNTITGEWARKAFDAITYQPKIKKSEMSNSEIDELNNAFGF